MIISELKRIDQYHGFMMIDHPSNTKVKVYFKNGSFLYDLNERKGILERVSKRPLFNDINYMHRNPGGLWTLFSDIFAASLIILAVSGLFILKGKNGLAGRGKWILTAGSVISIIFMIILIN